jgi:hypothetical protein
VSSIRVRLHRISVLLMYSLLHVDVPEITKSFANHVQTSLARQAYNLGMSAIESPPNRRHPNIGEWNR